MVRDVYGGVHAAGRAGHEVNGLAYAPASVSEAPAYVAYLASPV